MVGQSYIFYLWMSNFNVHVNYNATFCGPIVSVGRRTLLMSLCTNSHTQ